MRNVLNHVRLALSAVLCSLAAQATADDVQRRVEITPLLGYVAGGTFEDKLTNQELDLDDSSAFGLKLNIRDDNQTTWEFQYAKQETQTVTPTQTVIDVTVEKFELGGTYEVNSEPTRPYVAATVGVSRFEPQDNTLKDDTYFSFSLGGGVQFFADRPLGVSVDARWVAAVIDEDSDVFCLSSGGLTCVIQTDAGLASQFRVFVGLNARFW